MKRYPDLLTQKEIIKLIKLGIYCIDPITAKVTRGGKAQTPVEDSNGRLYVRLYYEDKRKAIALSRLVWISQTLQSIPRNFEIDHDDGDKQNNSWDNLVCLHELDHRKKHSTERQEEIPF